MANQKISELPEETAPVGSDLLAVVTDLAGTPTTKKVQLQNLGFHVGLISATQIVTAHALTSFSNNSGNHEVGETVNDFTLSWAYNRNMDNPTSQSINQGIGSLATNLRLYNVTGAGLTTNTTYTISAVGDDGSPSSLSTTIPFYYKRYWGISDLVITDGAAFMSIIGAQNSEFGTSRAVTKTFDASAGTPPNFLYFGYPQAWGMLTYSTFNTFPFTDYSVTTATVTNGQGVSVPIYIVRTNNNYAGAGLVWSIS